MTIKLVTFDLDNTLWDNHPVLLRAEKSCYDYLCECVPQLTSRYSQEDLATLRLHLMASSPQLDAQVSKVRKLAMRKALENVLDDAAHIASVVEQAFGHFHTQRNQVELFPQAIPLLEQLRPRYRLGAITNGNSDLEKIGLARYFEFSLSAENVGAKKPRPNLFHAALHKGNVKAHEMVHIGDHHEDDIFGAQQLGIHTIWFNPARLRWEDQSTRSPPSAVVHCLSDIHTALDRL